MDDRISSVSLQKYVIQFAGVYVLCNITIFAITTLFNFDVPSSMGIVTLIASTAPVMQSFVKREQRVPSSRERDFFSGFMAKQTLKQIEKAKFKKR